MRKGRYTEGKRKDKEGRDYGRENERRRKGERKREGE